MFCLLYRDKKNLLSLYNAMNGTNYEKEDELEVVTLEEAICMKMRNDAAFVIDSTLNLYEQQANVNPNMPLRNLYYVTEELKKITPPGRLHRTTNVTIPAPRFVVFYNGTAEQPERAACRLSDLFSGEEKEPELELIVTTININPGCNGELLAKCESLQGYMAFVGKVRDKRDAGVKLEEAVHQAVNECISENILTDFFKKNKEEIVEMSVYEFDQEVYDQVLLENGEEIGVEKGIKHAALIFKKVQDGETDDKAIAESIGCTLKEVEMVRKQFGI